MIQIKNLTKDYGNQKGIFGVEIEVKKGEVFGYLGPNGAGKTTTIRHLLGFLKPEIGNCFIEGKDCFKESEEIMKNVGYIPGEIAFMPNMTGFQFLEFMQQMKGIKEFKKAEELLAFFDVDASGSLKKMSKGMKQKIALVSAFMGDPDILILDEPSAGLDPLMQNRFVEWIRLEKKKGKTIFLSSHSFEEVEKTCDTIAIIRKGKIVKVSDVKTLNEQKIKRYRISFATKEEAIAFTQENIQIDHIDGTQIQVLVQDDLNGLLNILTKYSIVSLDSINQGLEEIFLEYYGENHHD